MGVKNRLISVSLRFSCEEVAVSEQMKRKGPLITKFPLISGFLFVPQKKFDSGKIRILILDVYAACPEPNTSLYFRFSKE